MTDKNQQVRDIISQHSAEGNGGGRYGIVQSYDTRTNTATVLMSSTDSDAVGDILTNVLCPVTLGIQTVAPEAGRPCWVVFKGERNDKKAMISHYFNHRFDTYDYSKQYNTNSSMPRYMLGM